MGRANGVKLAGHYGAWNYARGDGKCCQEQIYIFKSWEEEQIIEGTKQTKLFKLPEESTIGNSGSTLYIYKHQTTSTNSRSGECIVTG